jgi:UDP:flavonoid glycosyltransferase YjiC (YdhE family)
VRLPTYSFDPADLTGAIDRLLADAELKARLGAVAERLQASPGNERAAELIALMASTAEPVASR